MRVDVRRFRTDEASDESPAQQDLNGGMKLRKVFCVVSAILNTAGWRSRNPTSGTEPLPRAYLCGLNRGLQDDENDRNRNRVFTGYRLRCIRADGRRNDFSGRVSE